MHHFWVFLRACMVKGLVHVLSLSFHVLSKVEASCIQDDNSSDMLQSAAHALHHSCSKYLALMFCPYCARKLRQMAWQHFAEQEEGHAQVEEGTAGLATSATHLTTCNETVLFAWLPINRQLIWRTSSIHIYQHIAISNRHRSEPNSAAHSIFWACRLPKHPCKPKIPTCAATGLQEWLASEQMIAQTYP
jgi:hypothetical protein